MTLAGSPLVSFVGSENLNRAKTFYCETLGLTLLGESSFALEFDVAGTMLRVTKVEECKPRPYTVLGWQVADIRSAVADLARKRVEFEIYASMPQDALGIWTSPSGARVAWFKDPDGNTLSLTEFAAA